MSDEKKTADHLDGTFKFSCQSCGQRISADSRQIDSHAECPTCGRELIVPPDDSNSEFQIEKSAQPTKPILKNLGKISKQALDGARIGVSELKRHSHNAATLTRLEKLNKIDLVKAHYELGKKSLEEQLSRDNLTPLLDQIENLDFKVNEFSNPKSPPNPSRSKVESAKELGKGAARAGQIQALQLKRKHLVTALGKQVEESIQPADSPSLEELLQAVADVRQRILTTKGDLVSSETKRPRMVKVAAIVAIFFTTLFCATHLMTSSRNQSGYSENEKIKSQQLFEKGLGFINGDGVQKDEKAGLKWLKKAAKHGNADAQWFLGRHYLAEGGSSKDLARAVEFLKQAASQKHPRACQDLGECYADGIGVKCDPKKATHWLATAALETIHLPRDEQLGDHPLMADTPG